jgi:hypothetical protein
MLSVKPRVTPNRPSFLTSPVSGLDNQMPDCLKMPNCRKDVHISYLDRYGGEPASSADDVRSDDVAPSASCSPMLLRCSSLVPAMSSGRLPVATPAAASEGAGGGASELRPAFRPAPPRASLRPRPLTVLCSGASNHIRHRGPDSQWSGSCRRGVTTLLTQLHTCTSLPSAEDNDAASCQAKC